MLLYCLSTWMTVKCPFFRTLSCLSFLFSLSFWGSGHVLLLVSQYSFMFIVPSVSEYSFCFCFLAVDVGEICVKRTRVSASRYPLHPPHPPPHLPPCTCTVFLSLFHPSHSLCCFVGGLGLRASCVSLCCPTLLVK